MVAVPKIWPGSTVACLATGPSLTQADVDACSGVVRTIAINDAYRLAPWADVLYSSDRNWYPKHDGVPAFTGPKYGIGSSPGKANPFSKYPDIQVLQNTGYHGLERHPGGLRNGKNSGYAAINLAVHFGAMRIVLLGYNMGRAHGKSHFFGSHPSGLIDTPEALYVTFRQSFETLLEPLREAGVEVINCTPDSSLSCFPTMDLRAALAGAEVVA